MTQALDISLVGYPTLTGAAAMLEISPSTLSRRDDLLAERMGERDRRIPPAEVMRLAGVYRKRSLNEVAADLIEHAEQHAPETAELVDAQVQRFFAERAPPDLGRRAFLAEARRALPPDLYREVKRTYRAGGERPQALVSSD